MGISGYEGLTAEWTNAALSVKILDTLESIRDTLKESKRYPRGTTLTLTLHILNTSPITRIDFIKATGHRNIPGGAIVDILEVPLSHLTINNQGPGDVLFDTNRSISDVTARTPLKQNESIEIPAGEPSIFAINLAAVNSDAVITLMGIV